MLVVSETTKIIRMDLWEISWRTLEGGGECLLGVTVNLLVCDRARGCTIFCTVSLPQLIVSPHHINLPLNEMWSTNTTCPLLFSAPPPHICTGNLEQSMGARNRVGIGLSYRPAMLHRQTESIPWNWFPVLDFITIKRARNWIGIGLSYQPAWLQQYRLENLFLGFNSWYH